MDGGSYWLHGVVKVGSVTRGDTTCRSGGSFSLVWAWLTLYVICNLFLLTAWRLIKGMDGIGVLGEGGRLARYGASWEYSSSWAATVPGLPCALSSRYGYGIRELYISSLNMSTRSQLSCQVVRCLGRVGYLRRDHCGSVMPLAVL